MTERHPYTYTILRYVHDPRAGEMLNVGIVVHVASERLLLARTRPTFGRVKDAFPDLIGPAFTESMRALDRAIGRVAKELAEAQLFVEGSDAASLARLALQVDDSSLQWSPVGSGLTDDPNATLERLFERLVRRHDGQTPRRRTDDDVWRPLRDRLAERRVHIPFEEKVIRGSLDSITFGRAWKNGVWHAYEPVSLDMADGDGVMDKTRRWLGHLAAVKDAQSEQLRLHFILGAPQDGALHRDYLRAVALFRKADLAPEVIEEDGIDGLVTQIETELRAHHDAAVSDD
jgi:hypothetical protein